MSNPQQQQEIDELKAQVARLEAQIAKPTPQPEPAFTKGPDGLMRDARGRRKKGVNQEARERTAQEVEETKRLRLTTEFEKLTRGLYKDNPGRREAELAIFITSEGGTMPSRWRDPTGLIRDRHGNRAGIAEREQQEALEVMAEMRKEAGR